MGNGGKGGAGVVLSAARGINDRREQKALAEHCASLQSSTDAASQAIEELLLSHLAESGPIMSSVCLRSLARMDKSSSISCKC